jgi:adenosylcobinamide-GDP ribazoletransferase
MIRRFLGAVQFLTVIPIRGETAPPGACAAFYPCVGALLGAAGAGLYLLLPAADESPAIAAMLVLAFWTVATGALHEDGLADVADAVRSYRARQEILAILKDPRVGTFGALALVFSVSLRWVGLSGFASGQDPCRLTLGLAAAQALPRAALVLLAWTSRPAAFGTGAAFQADLSRTSVWIAMITGSAIALGPGIRLGLITILTALLLVLWAHRWFHRRIGGVTGDCLGATAQAVETAVLVIYSWPFFTR